jgi:hypothetical protein
MVRAYSTLVWICFLFSLALTVFAFYLVFSKSALIHCLDKDLQEVTCSSVLGKGKKVAFVASNVVALFIQLCKPVSLSSPSQNYI